MSKKVSPDDSTSKLPCLYHISAIKRVTIFLKEGSDSIPFFGTKSLLIWGLSHINEGLQTNIIGCVIFNKNKDKHVHRFALTAMQ